MAAAHVAADLGVTVHLVVPGQAYLDSYLGAAELGWSSMKAAMDPDAAAFERASILADPADFLAELNDPLGLGRPLTLDDGTQVPRLPGQRRWMWDGEYCGAISLRRQPGTMDLPPTCLGHIGYAVVPWKRRLGYARSALEQILTLAGDDGMPWVDIVTDAENVASQGVVLANGGAVIEEFTAPETSGSFHALRWRIPLSI